MAGGYDGNESGRAKLGWDARVVLGIVMGVWLAAMIVDMTSLWYDVPVYLHGGMLAIVGYFFRAWRKNGNGNGSGQGNGSGDA